MTSKYRTPTRQERIATALVIAVALALVVGIGLIALSTVPVAAQEADGNESGEPTDPEDDPLRGGDDDEDAGEPPTDYQREIVADELYVVESQLGDSEATLEIWSSEERTLQTQDVSVFAAGEDSNFAITPEQETVGAGESTITIPTTSSDDANAVSVSWDDSGTLRGTVISESSGGDGIIRNLNADAALLTGAAIVFAVAGVAGYRARKQDYVDKPVSPFNRGGNN